MIDLHRIAGATQIEIGAIGLSRRRVWDMVANISQMTKPTCFLGVVLFGLIGCTRSDVVIREMTWEAGPYGVRFTFTCAPNIHVAVNSPELLSLLRQTGQSKARVEFEVHRLWWDQSVRHFDVVAVNGQKTGSWRAADGYMEGTGRLTDPFTRSANDRPCLAIIDVRAVKVRKENSAHGSVVAHAPLTTTAVDRFSF